MDLGSKQELVFYGVVCIIEFSLRKSVLPVNIPLVQNPPESLEIQLLQDHPEQNENNQKQIIKNHDDMYDCIILHQTCLTVCICGWYSQVVL